MMNAVAEVDVGMTSRPEHHFGPGSAAVVVGMTGFVFRTSVGFCFDDACCGADSFPLRDQYRSQQFLSDCHDIIP